MDSVLQKEKKCYVCGTPYNLHSHHVFYGTSCRKQSEKLGLKLWLCYLHHNGSNQGVHFNMALDNSIKRMAQEYYEKNIGDRKSFIDRFIRSYL